MTDHVVRFDADSVRESWDRAARSPPGRPLRGIQDAAQVPYYVFFDLVKAM
jgi:hypothetical protein